MHKHILIALFALGFINLSYGQICHSNITHSAPDSRYRLLNNDTEVQDGQTGLIWQRCSLGQTWSGNTCTGTATGYTWGNAMQTPKITGNGWRVPNVKELKSLVEVACNNAINETYFPVTSSNAGYWSSTPTDGAGFFAGAWVVDFFKGFANNYCGRGCSNYVRLVRSSQ